MLWNVLIALNHIWFSFVGCTFQHQTNLNGHKQVCWRSSFLDVWRHFWKWWPFTIYHEVNVHRTNGQSSTEVNNGDFQPAEITNTKNDTSVYYLHAHHRCPLHRFYQRRHSTNLRTHRRAVSPHKYGCYSIYCSHRQVITTFHAVVKKLFSQGQDVCVTHLEPVSVNWTTSLHASSITSSTNMSSHDEWVSEKTHSPVCDMNDFYIIRDVTSLTTLSRLGDGAVI